MYSHVETTPNVHARKRQILAVIRLWNESKCVVSLSLSSSNGLPLVLCSTRVSANGRESSYWHWRLLVLIRFRRKLSAVALPSVCLLSSGLVRCVITRKIMKSDNQTD